ncbi:hypothetical protein [Marinobacter mobilis]|uniref:hypothetical protein n=1 Tax=Marinobacter mobilis TaxID=488533 RepID=UPI0035C762A9
MFTTQPLGRAIRSAHDHQRTTWWSAALVALVLGSGGVALAACSPCNPCRGRCRASQQCRAGGNPCAAKAGCCAANPCAANPCASRNPCASKNPCATRCNPCANSGCNPCSAAGRCSAAPNPCAAKRVTRPASYQPYEGNPYALMAKGEALFNDTSLSSNGLSCSSCHSGDAGYNATFAVAYPHSVAMAKNVFGLDSVYLDEMVQICMVQPMAAEPLDWNGEALAALTAYMETVQNRVAANPCALQGGGCGACKPCNPCNPCEPANPCAGKNPCAVKAPTDTAAHDLVA